MLVLATTLCATSLPFAYIWTARPRREQNPLVYTILKETDDQLDGSGLPHTKQRAPDDTCLRLLRLWLGDGPQRPRASCSCSGPRQDLYKDFFLQAADGPSSRTPIASRWARTRPTASAGFAFWQRERARDYFVDHLVGPLAAAGTIDGVFFDAVSSASDIPRRDRGAAPSSSVPDCDGRLNVSGCDALVAGTIDVAARATTLLNARQDTDLCQPGLRLQLLQPHDRPRRAAPRDGARRHAVAQLLRVGARRAARRRPKVGDALLRNMLREGTAGVPVGVHAYYSRNATTGVLEDVTPHVAAFLLARAVLLRVDRLVRRVVRAGASGAPLRRSRPPPRSNMPGRTSLPPGLLAWRRDYARGAQCSPSSPTTAPRPQSSTAQCRAVLCRIHGALAAPSRATRAAIFAAAPTAGPTHFVSTTNSRIHPRPLHLETRKAVRLPPRDLAQTQKAMLRCCSPSPPALPLLMSKHRADYLGRRRRKRRRRRRSRARLHVPHACR